MLEIGFIDAVESVVKLIEAHPGAGSALHAGLLPSLPAPLRFHPVRRFNGYLIYYVELPAHVSIVRIWNASRGMEGNQDMPTYLFFLLSSFAECG